MCALVSGWLLLAAAIVLLLYVAGTWTHGHFRRHALPFVRPLPFLGSMGPLTFRRLAFPDFVQDIYNRYKDLPVFGIFQFHHPVVVIRDPDVIRMVAVKDFDHFVDHTTLVTDKLDPIMGKNLFSLKGQEWREMRATLSPAFTSSKMRNMFKLIDECGAQMAKHIGAQIAASPGKVFETEFKDFFSRFTNDVIATSAFGIQVDSLNDRSNEFYLMGLDLTNTKGFKTLLFLGFMLSPKLMEILNLPFVTPKMKKFFTDIVMGTIKERQKKGIFRPDMLQLLIQARDGQLKVDKEDEHEAENIKADKRELSNEDITAQAVIFFFAGFDTVSTLMCFTALSLARHPHIQQRVQREIDEACAGGAFSYEAAQNMKYLDMVMNETLRMYPPVAFLDRNCVKEYTLPARGGLPAYTVRRGDTVWFPVHGLHMDPDYWPDPERFDPERFSDANKANIKPFTYMPFGAGPRVCIGSRFALLETKIALGHVLRRFSFVMTPRTPATDAFVKGDFNTTIEGGFWLGLTPRAR